MRCSEIFPSWDELAKYVRKKRKSLGLTQRSLAEGTGVSQSLIAKLESGRTKISYDRIKAIYDYLDTLETGKVPLAKDIHSIDVVAVEKNQPVKEAVELMIKDGFSQLPVREGDQWVGSITETSILHRLGETSKETLYQKPVGEVMDRPLPIVDENTPITAIKPLLDFNPAVLTARGGRVVGIITKSDLL